MVKRIEKISGINDKMGKKPQQQQEVFKRKLKKLPKIEKENKRESKHEGKIDVIV